MRTLILCGGRGTRALPHTAAIPKPLLEVGDRPVLAHLMEIFACQGRTDFVLAAGYRAADIVAFARTTPADWSVEVVDTGEDTGIAARISAVAGRMGDVFFATYGDGLADIDLDALGAHHTGHGRGATLTAVPLRSQYGTLDLSSEGAVTGFQEKPVLSDRWMNGGFFVFDRDLVESSFSGDDLERQVLPGLAAAGRLVAYRHTGFWQSMDTYKDAIELGELLGAGRPPWLPRVGAPGGAAEPPGAPGGAAEPPGVHGRAWGWGPHASEEPGVGAPGGAAEPPGA